MKKKYVIITGLIFLGIGLVWFLTKPDVQDDVDYSLEGECQITEMTYYYTETCSFCRRVRSEGTISKLNQLGVEINEINLGNEKPEHQISGVPAFIIEGNIYEGYRTFEELSGLLDCDYNDG